MGNVLATSAPPPPPLPSQFLAEDGDKGNDRLANNPGPLEELHRKCKDIFPVPFDGTKIVVSKALSNHFQTSHNFAIGSGITPSGYRFGATYIGTRQVSPSEVYPIFFGEVDPSGNLNSRIIHLIGDRLKLQVGTQIQNSKCVATHLNTDYLGSCYTASLALGNVDPIANSGVAVTSYLHNVTKNVALGGEVVAQYGSSTLNSVVSVAGRYTSPSDYIISGTLNQRGVQLCYYQKKNEHVQVGVQVETNLTEPDSTASFGYQIDMPKSNFTFKAFLDSNWNVGCTFEKKMLPLPFTFVCSGLLNHVKAQSRIGVGLNVG